ncbi:MAG TPA: amidophosphoribosyltransferase [Epulopiscium sp.]|nr:amidophosphoribosyltransferase [Candidatus Epulonipiscium sp.]
MLQIQDNKLNEECGVIGVISQKDATRSVYYGLYALQHRGQENAGIATNNDGKIECIKGTGLVSDVFTEEHINRLNGKIAIGHVRYAKTGEDKPYNAQPLFAKFKHGHMALAHNGSLVNSESVKEMLEDTGVIFQTTIDTESILNLLARNYKRGIEAAIKNTMSLIKGAYAIVLTTEDKLIGIRDPHGLRPLCLGKTKDGYALASESCALDTIGADYLRDVEPGEIIIIDQEGLKSIPSTSWCPKSLCIFELVYFARPDSKLDKVGVYKFRKEAGRELAKMGKIEADVVIPVPDSGIPSAVGFAEESGIPYAEGLVKNRYIGRTFIQPTQDMRESAVRIKLNVLRENIEGKRVVIVDDSIVRGTTMTHIIEQIRRVGGTEVHVCIASPPVAHPCYFGIDTPYRKHLIGATLSNEEICKLIGADSLRYLPIEGMERATGQTGGFCKACFDGEYPMEVPIEAEPNMGY